MKIVVDNAIPFLAGILEPYAEVVYIPGGSFTAEIVADSQALIVRTRTRCNSELLEGSRVEFIATATIGFDHIDMEYCRDHNIEVTTAAGCNARGVLQWVAAVLVALARRDGFLPSERTVGIVGVGNVGSLVKHYAERWGFNVICCDPPRQQREGLDFVTLETLLPQTDILTLHTPLDSTTRGMINRKTLALMRPNAVVINASRGEVVSTTDLLESGLDCAIDVWENEPDIDKTLLAKAFVTTPHIAGYSLQGKANATAMAVAALARHFGLPIENWYPPQCHPTTPQDIDWQTLNTTIDNYCNLTAQSAPLKSGADFETLRNDYKYREEYF